MTDIERTPRDDHRTDQRPDVQLTRPASLTYDFPGNVNNSRKNTMDPMYIPKMSHEEKANRREKIAREVEKAPVEKRRAAVVRLAEKHGLSPQSVRNACRAFKVEIPTPKRQRVTEQTLKIIGELVKGTSVIDISEKYDLTRARIYMIRAEAIEAGILKK